MKKRIIAAAAALVLAVVAGFGIYTYIQGADARALAGQETAEVLVVTKTVPRGATASEMTKSVEQKLMPRAAVAEGAVTDLGSIGDELVTTADLLPGELVLSMRFADPATLVDVNSAPVPAGLQQVSVQLDAQRALGGNIVPGNTVGVFLSMEVEKKDNGNGDTKDSLTHLVYHKVLVTKVQGGLAPIAEDADNAGTTAAMPSEESLMVTFAVNSAQAEKIVWTAEYGHVWLSQENADSDESGTRALTEEGLYR